MASEYSFDIVSQIDMAEVNNALNQTRKEAQTRYDFKGGNPIVEIRDKHIYLEASNGVMLESLREVLRSKLAKRNVSLKAFEEGKEEPTSKGAVKQKMEFKEGINKEEAKRLIALIKQKGLKVKTQIQDEKLRVTSKDKDELQKVIQLSKDNEGGIALQFVNYS